MESTDYFKGNENSDIFAEIYKICSKAFIERKEIEEAKNMLKKSENIMHNILDGDDEILLAVYNI